MPLSSAAGSAVGFAQLDRPVVLLAHEKRDNLFAAVHGVLALEPSDALVMAALLIRGNPAIAVSHDRHQHVGLVNSRQTGVEGRLFSAGDESTPS